MHPSASAPPPHDPSASWQAWFDGSALPNPGRIGIGGLLRAPDGRTVEVCAAAGEGDSSLAEFLALIAVLKAAHDAGVRRLQVFGDSQVVIDSVLRDIGAASRHAERSEVLALLARFESVQLKWIPRHRNSEADALSQRAIRRA